MDLSLELYLNVQIQV
jgi:hypothetical protein